MNVGNENRGQRRVSFAGSAVAVAYDGARAADIVRFLYRHVPARGDVPPQQTYRVLSDDRSGRLALYRDEALVYAGDCAATLAERLLGDTCRHLAEHSRGGLLFHAAALTRRGQGLLLPGGIGAGKTTLAAWLTTQGWNYLTDELVFVPQDVRAFQAFTRPLNLKKPARVALKPFFDFEANDLWSTPHADLVAPPLVDSSNPSSTLSLDFFLFPRYRRDSEFELCRLSGAQAGLALMQCLVNARNLPAFGFSEVARLARTVPAYRMCYAHFDQIGDYLETHIVRCGSRHR